MTEAILLPDEIASEEGIVAYVACDVFLTADEAIAYAAREDPLDRPVAGMRATSILMREESEVEARINGHEFPFWVPCTKRARAKEPYWRVEFVR